MLPGQLQETRELAPFQDLVRIERFRHVQVGARLTALLPVVFLALGGQQDDIDIL